jgi:hypothetical protein
MYNDPYTVLLVLRHDSIGGGGFDTIGREEVLISCWMEQGRYRKAEFDRYILGEYT